MPTSRRKIEANRRNALLSTGPRSNAGKAHSRLNALKHGLCARGQALPGTEDKYEFNQLVAGLDQLQPNTPMQVIALQQIADCYWRTLRLLRYELSTNPGTRRTANAGGQNSFSNLSENDLLALPHAADLEFLTIDELLKLHRSASREIARLWRELLAQIQEPGERQPAGKADRATGSSTSFGCEALTWSSRRAHAGAAEIRSLERVQPLSLFLRYKGAVLRNFITAIHVFENFKNCEVTKQLASQNKFSNQFPSLLLNELLRSKTLSAKQRRANCSS